MEAGPHRHRDPRDLTPAGAPSACRTSSSSRRLSFACSTPSATRDRADGLDPQPRARPSTWDRPRPGAGASRRAAHPRGGHGRPKTLVDLREDGRQGQGVRRDLRPGGIGSWSIGWRMLRRAWARSTPRGSRCRGAQGLHACPSSPSRACTPRWWAQGKPLEVQIRTREMPPGRGGSSRPLGYKDAFSPTTSPGSATWSTGVRDQRSSEFMETPEVDLEHDEVLSHRKGRVATCPTAPPRSTSPTPSTPRSVTPDRRPAVNGRLQPLDSKLQSGDSGEIFTSKVESGHVARHGCRSSQPRARQQDPPVVLRERREDAMETGRRRWSRPSAARAACPKVAASRSWRRWPPS